RRTVAAIVQGALISVAGTKARQQEFSPGKRSACPTDYPIAGRRILDRRRSREKGTAPLSDAALRHQQAATRSGAQARFSTEAHHAAGAAALRGGGVGQRRVGRLDHLYAYRFDAHFRRRTERCAATHSGALRKELSSRKTEYVSLEKGGPGRARGDSADIA